MRIGVLLLILFVVATGAYLNQIGLPGFLKRPLLQKLHARGVDLQFSRLRLRWYRGIVAENVRFGRVETGATNPQLSLDEVQVRFNHEALKQFKLSVDSLILNGGRLLWTLRESNQPTKELAITNIQTQLRFLPKDLWELDRLNASFAGASLQFSGAITNASLIRDWKIFHPQAAQQPGRLQENLRRFAETMEKIKLSDAAQLKLRIHGDARNLESFNGILTLDTPTASTPWGTLTNGLLDVQLIQPGATNDHPLVDFRLHADEALTPWGVTKGFQLGLRVVTDQNPTNLVKCHLELLADQFTTEWAQATNAQFTAQWAHSLTNPIPISGTGKLELADARTRWCTAGRIQITGRLNTPETVGPRRADRRWAWWAALEPYFIDWDCQLRDVHAQDQTREFQVKEVACGGLWRAPELTITNLYSELYQGKLRAHASVDVATRRAAFEYVSNFDIQKATPLLTEKGRQWLEQFSWEKPPAVSGGGGLILPAWTNRHPDFRSEVLPTLDLHGEFQTAQSAFRNVPVRSAYSHFAYSNMVWNLPDLVATRPEGEIHVGLRADDLTKEFYFRIQSGIDIKSVQPLLGPREQKVFDMISLAQPPNVEGEIWGRWHEPGRTGFRAQVSIGNFAFRGESGTSCRGSVQYTNHILRVANARAERGSQYATVATADFDFDRKQGAITNGFSTMDPMPGLRMIGPKVAKTMEPYQFLNPPTVRMNGIIPLAPDADVDAHFDIDGGPFQWQKFNIDHITGKAHWVGDHLLLNEAKAAFYQGTLTGSASFDFNHARGGADFSFDTIVTDCNPQLLLTDLFAHTNQFEGRLSGHLNITSANTRDTNSWFGQGQVDLHNGLIWTIPIFGIFSQVLDDIVPGLGKTRASEAAGTFLITNSVIRSDDLEIRAPALRMKYRGTVDFSGRLDAKVEAELLRDTWVVGRVLSTVLWPLTKAFEYKVTGTLAKPIKEPLYILPKVLSMPFHPFRSFRQIFPGDSNGTNAPPAINNPQSTFGSDSNKQC
jgi:hypothetical protein